MINSKPMLKLTGKVLNVFKAPEGTNQETGEKFGGEMKVQFQCENQLRNGETRIELVTLTERTPGTFQDLQNQWVEVPVGVFVAGRAVRYYMADGAPIALSDNDAATKEGVL